jgi:hypothetical protein
MLYLYSHRFHDKKKCWFRRAQVSFLNWCDILTSVCGENFPWSLGGELWGIAHVGCLSLDHQDVDVYPISIQSSIMG